MQRRERILGFFICMILMVPTVFAASNQNIEAEMITNSYVHYSVNYDDMFHIKDNYMPIIKYEDVLYAPIRQVGDIIGLDISWDSATNTITVDTMSYEISDTPTPMAMRKVESPEMININAGMYKQIHIILNGCLTSSADLNKKHSNAIIYDNSCYFPIDYLEDLFIADMEYDENFNLLSISDNAKYKLAINSLINLINTSSNSIEKLDFAFNKKDSEFIMSYMTRYYRNNTHYNFRFLTISSGDKETYPTFFIDENRSLLDREKNITNKTLEAIKEIAPTLKDKDSDLVRKVNRHVRKTYKYDMDYYINHGLEGYSTPINVEQILNEENNMLVCHGYATIFSYYCNHLGVRTEYIKGYINGGDDYHAWNRSLVNGEWLYTDVTWNSSGNTDRYLMLTENKMDYYHDV